MDTLHNCEHIEVNPNVKSNFKEYEVSMMNKLINLEKLEEELKKSGKSFIDYIIREVPEQILSLLYIIKDVVRDPRRKTGNFKYDITPIMGIIFLSILVGYDFVKSMFNHGRDLWKVIAALLEIKSDYPSYDTFRRVLNSTNNQELAEVRKRWHESIGITYVGDSRNNCEKDSKEFEDFSRDWIEKANRDLDALIQNQYHPPVRVCAQDGKLMKATRSRVNKEPARDVISIFDVQTNEVLAESLVPNKKNEISENPNVVDKLDPSYNYLISFDAMGCQKDLARDIQNHDWYYLFKVKSNQPTLLNNISECFDKYGGLKIFSRASTEGGHYTEWTFYVSDRVDKSVKEWAGVKSYGMVITYSERDGEVTEEKSYFVMNFLDPALFVYAKIMHWRIENKLHHPLDCVFNEDRCRVRSGFGHQNLNTIRKGAVTFYRYALKLLGNKFTSFGSLLLIVRKSIFSLNKCIKNVKMDTSFSIKDLLSEVVNI